MHDIELSLRLADAISVLKRHLTNDGFSFRAGHSFKDFDKILRNSDKKLTEHFSTMFNTFTPDEGFWILLLDQDNNPVGTVAARLHPLGRNMSLAQWLQEYVPRIYKAEDGGPSELGSDQPAFCREALGRVVYLGEAWVARDVRREHLGGDLVKLIQLMSLLYFNPDFLFCWIRPKHAMTGFPQACGYKEVFPRAIRWIKPPAADLKVTDLWLAGNRRGGLEDLAGDVLADYDCLLHKVTSECVRAD